MLVEKGWVPSREKARALILSGQVLVADQPQDKCGFFVSEGIPIRIRGEPHPYVSRGGVKLAKALEQFKIEVKSKIALDIGASTGGFTQVLLLKGASRVHAIDVGYNQMAWKIRTDPRVFLQEKTNARSLEFHQIGEKVDLIVIDVSFISLEKIFSPLRPFCKSHQTDWITLIKPQFEVGKAKLGKGGIVRCEKDHAEVILRITQHAQAMGLTRLQLAESPIKGATGNKEFFAHWKIK